jgi:hypothetical protein
MWRSVLAMLSVPPILCAQQPTIAAAIDGPLFKQNFGRESQLAPMWVWFCLPILIPLILVMVVVCGIRGQDCSC